MTSTNSALNKRLDPVEVLLKQFSVALKSLRFYPPNHAIPTEAVAKFLNDLDNYLRNKPSLIININKKGIILDGEIIGKNNPSFNRLTHLFYAFKIKQVGFLPGISPQEIIDFLSILCMDIDDVLVSGGVKELLWQKNIDHIIIKELMLNIVNIESVPSDIAEPVSEEQFDELRNLLESNSTLSSDDERRILVRFKLDAGQIAQFLSQAAQNGSGGGGVETEVDYLAGLLSKIGGLLNQELPDEQMFLSRNLAEALMLLPSNLREKLTYRLFLNQDNASSLQNHIVAELSPHELANLISQASGNKHLADQDLVAFVKRLPIRAESVKPLISALIKKLPLNNEVKTGLTSLLKTKKTFNEVTTEDEKIVEDQDEYALMVLDIAQEEVNSIASEIEKLDEETIARETAFVLTESYKALGDEKKIAKIANSLKNLLAGSIKSKQFVLALDLLKELQESAAELNGFSTQAPIKEAMKAISTREIFVDLIDYIRTENNAEDIRLIYLLLRQMGNQTANTLLEMLATEVKARNRKIICTLLADISKDEISDLGKKIYDHRWYLVRNVVHILGRTKNPQVVDILKKTAIHDDPRVRRETISALAAIGGHESARILINFLTDNEIELRQLAVKELGSIGNDEDVAILINILKKRDILYINLNLKIEVAMALGKIAAIEAIPVLEQLSHRKSLLFRSKNEHLRQAAGESLAKIRADLNQHILKPVNK